MKISFIVAVGTNYQMGLSGKLPWGDNLYKEDLKRFKYLTLGKPVLMGRKTFESIGHPLSGRTNIVISYKEDYKAAGSVVFDDINKAIEWAYKVFPNDELMVIGGEQIYSQLINDVDRMYITIIQYNKNADKYFPGANGDFQLLYEEKDKEGNIFKILEKNK